MRFKEDIEEYIKDLKNNLYEEKKYYCLLCRAIEEDNKHYLEEEKGQQEEKIKQLEEEIKEQEERAFFTPTKEDLKEYYNY